MTTEELLKQRQDRRAAKNPCQNCLQEIEPHRLAWADRENARRLKLNDPSLEPIIVKFCAGCSTNNRRRKGGLPPLS